MPEFTFTPEFLHWRPQWCHDLRWCCGSRMCLWTALFPMSAGRGQLCGDVWGEQNGVRRSVHSRVVWMVPCLSLRRRMEQSKDAELAMTLRTSGRSSFCVQIPVTLWRRMEQKMKGSHRRLAGLRDIRRLPRTASLDGSPTGG